MRRSPVTSVASTTPSASSVAPESQRTWNACASVVFATSLTETPVWKRTPSPSSRARIGCHSASSKFAFATSKTRPSLEPRK